MKITDKMIVKRIYNTPTIELIQLDNEISLALESISPPEGPGESVNVTTEYKNNEPFRVNMG